jgi:hypothetical protein
MTEDFPMDTSLKLRIHSSEAERFLRFSLVGALGTLVDFGLLIVLKEAARSAAQPAELRQYCRWLHRRQSGGDGPCPLLEFLRQPSLDI